MIAEDAHQGLIGLYVDKSGKLLLPDQVVDLCQVEIEELGIEIYR